MTDVIRVLGLLLVGSLVLAAFFAVLAALFPDRLARAQSVAARSPGRALVVGLINGIFAGAIITALLALADWTGIQLFVVPALVLLVLLAIAATLGLGGVAQLVGGRLAPAGSPSLRPALGGVAVGLACAAPFAGWFGLLPYVVLLGLGACLLSLFERGVTG